MSELRYLLNSIEENIKAYVDSTNKLMADFKLGEISFDKTHMEDKWQTFRRDWIKISIELRKYCIDTTTLWDLNSTIHSLVDHDEYDELKESKGYNKLMREFSWITFVLGHETHFFQFVPYSIEHLKEIEVMLTKAFKAFWTTRKFMQWFIKNKDKSGLSDEMMKQLDDEFMFTFN